MAVSLARKGVDSVLPHGVLYRAFLSYRSTNRDLAERLTRKLEAWRTPRALVGKPGRYGPVPAGLGRICRDREEFPTAPYIDGVVAEKLSQSQMLVVLCTPEAADETSWVSREIELFRKLRPDGAIHAIIGRGEPPACFPASLLTRDEAGRVHQPLAADMRQTGDGPDKAVVKLIAGLLGLDFDTLWQRERRRRRARVLRLLAGASAIVTGFFYADAWMEAGKWRTSLVAESKTLWSNGRTLDALPLALAGVSSAGSIIPGSGDEAMVALIRQPGLALHLDLGAQVSGYRISPDGTTLSLSRGDGTASLLDLRSGAVTPIAKTTDQPIFGAKAAQVFYTVSGNVGIVADLKSGTRVELGALVEQPAFSPDGNRIAAVSGAGEAFLLDLVSSRRTLLPGLKRIRAFSKDGRWLIARNDANAWLAVELATGAQTLLGDLKEPPRFVMNGARLLLWQEDYGAKLFDPGSGGFEELGKSMSQPALSPDGRQLTVDDENLNLWLVDRRSRERVNLGSGIAPVFSPNGAWLKAVAIDGRSFLIDMATRKRGVLGGLAGADAFQFSPNGKLLMGIDQKAGFVIDIASQRRTPLGDVDDFPQFTPNGRWLVAQRGLEAFVIDPRRQARAASTAAETAREWCDLGGIGRLVRPLFPALRDPSSIDQLKDDEQVRQETVIYPILRGRPWNPCDWRGLGAIFPNGMRGDGWFEGLKQWWRSVSVRRFGAPDYRCGETVSGADDSLRRARVTSCRIVGAK